LSLLKGLFFLGKKEKATEEERKNQSKEKANLSEVKTGE